MPAALAWPGGTIPGPMGAPCTSTCELARSGFSTTAPSAALRPNDDRKHTPFAVGW